MGGWGGGQEENVRKELKKLKTTDAKLIYHPTGVGFVDSKVTGYARWGGEQDALDVEIDVVPFFLLQKQKENSRKRD